MTYVVLALLDCFVGDSISLPILISSFVGGIPPLLIMVGMEKRSFYQCMSYSDGSSGRESPDAICPFLSIHELALSLNLWTIQMPK